ncbi:hypothetical protein ACSBR1_021525 [Camellia fascicularis]
MMKQSLKFFFPIMNSTMKLFKKEVSCQRFVYNVLNRYQSQWSNGEKVENNVSKEAKNASQVSVTPKVDKNVNDDSQIWKYSPNNDDDLSDSKWKLELAWFTKALEPALQLYRRAMPTGLARNSMLRESNIVKFIKDSSIMRPGYYIGIDARKRLVILGIRGTQTVYDLITDIATSSTEEVTFEGYSTHFGTAEAARWFLSHEMGTIKKCLEKHEGFRLRLVGHSLGGATASLLAIMLRRKSSKELGFSPDIVTAIGYATPPCVSRELAECCSDYVTTVVMQDDIIPRLSVASLTRLRNEILQTDWMSALEKEDWKNVIGLVSNAKNVVSSVQDVARKLADYAKFGGQTKVSGVSSTSKAAREIAVLGKKDSAMPEEELFVPGTLYYLKRNIVDNRSSSNEKGRKFFTLWRRHPGEHFQRILLSNNLISDHKCDSYYYALRDVLKGFPGPIEETIFKHK